MLELYNAAVEADNDDDDCISPDAFIDQCYVAAVGIGIHPRRRQEMVMAANVRSGS